MEVIKGMFILWDMEYDSKILLQAVGIIGAVIMPHNLYLHSALVKVRKKLQANILETKKLKIF